MKSSAIVDVKGNVQIRYLDRHGKVIRETTKHNKATVNLVDGILRFLKGDFNSTVYRKISPTAPNEAELYIPVRAAFGRVGVKITSADKPENRRFNYIDKNEFVVPTFDSDRLQEEVVFQNDTDYTLLKFSKVSQVGYTDNNNSECLEFSLYINPGKLVGYNEDTPLGKKFVPYDWSYYNPEIQEYEAMFTEVGLFSGSNILLARVLFDGDVTSNEYYNEEGESQGKYPILEDFSDDNNPVIQSESTTIVLVWRIGIVSVGKNDELTTQNNLTTSEFTRNLSSELFDYVDRHIDGDWKQGYTPSVVVNDISKIVSQILSGNDMSSLNKELSGQ